jgi:hypothetical protein
MCKAISAVAFLGGAAFHGYRTANLWKFFPMREKAFNALGFFVLLGIAAANANAGYQIYMG